MFKDVTDCPPRSSGKARSKAKSTALAKRPLRILTQLINPDTLALCYPGLEDRLIWQQTDYYTSFTIVFFKDELREQVNIAKARSPEATALQTLRQLVETGSGPYPKAIQAGNEFLSEFAGQAAEAYFLSSKTLDERELIVLRRDPSYGSNDLLNKDLSLYSRIKAGCLGRSMSTDNRHNYYPKDKPRGYTLFLFNDYHLEPVWVRTSLLDRIERRSPSEARMMGSIIRAQAAKLLSSGKLSWIHLARIDTDPPEKAFSQMKHQGLFLYL